MQTGIDLVCGPEAELCACYHNGWELLSGEESTVHDGAFLVCWLDIEPREAIGARTGDAPLTSPVTTVTYPSGGDCVSPYGDEADFRQ